MSLERGRFGIEYKPRPRKRDSSAIGPIVFVVLGIAAISFAVTKLRRQPDEFSNIQEPTISQPTQPQSQPSTPQPSQHPNTSTTSQPLNASTSHPTNSFLSSETRERPPKVRNLLLRLDEAEKMDNIEMAATTIETLRSLPGEPAADLDDRLARHLGKLNSRRLFTLANRQWVTEVTVRPRESATRIAAAHGSTLSSLIRLNELKDADNIKVGQVLKVMNHPRFSLTVHRRARYADLHLNGKFFNRYDITGDAEICPVGVYKTVEKLREQLSTLGLKFSIRDRVELETLIPPNASIVVSET